MKFFHRFFILIFLFTPFVASWGLTAAEVYENGRRAFLLGHWDDAYFHFEEFLSLFPGNVLEKKVRQFHVLADIRRQPTLDEERVTSRIASWSSVLAGLQKDMPAGDLTEITAAIEMQRKTLVRESPSWPAIGLLSPDQMAHALRRKWYPDPTFSPLATLNVIQKWLTTTGKNCSTEVAGQLALLQAKALWQVQLSPLAAEALSEILRERGFWPIDQALRTLLKQAFDHGDLDVKKEAALLGVSVDSVKVLNSGTYKNSRWNRYLQERGLHRQEAWCPR